MRSFAVARWVHVASGEAGGFLPRTAAVNVLACPGARVG
jgi:hypothetical protein